MLATVQELERHLKSAGTVSGGAAIDRELLEDLLEAASDRIAEERPERTLEPLPALVNTGTAEAPVLEDTADPVERTFAAAPTVQVPDLREVTSIRFDDGDELAATDYELVRRRPDWPAIYVRQITGLWLGRRRLRITGRWGPAESSTLEPKRSVRHAALVWAAAAYYKRQARYADAMTTPDGAIGSYFRQLPPDVMATVKALWIPGP